MREHVRGNVLNSYPLGGVLTYFAFPQLRVWIDSRADPFPPPTTSSTARRSTAAAALVAFADRYANSIR